MCSMFMFHTRSTTCFLIEWIFTKSCLTDKSTIFQFIRAMWIWKRYVCIYKHIFVNELNLIVFHFSKYILSAPLNITTVISKFQCKASGAIRTWYCMSFNQIKKKTSSRPVPLQYTEIERKKSLKTPKG
jgi:hypothetical protein